MSPCVRVPGRGGAGRPADARGRPVSVCPQRAAPAGNVMKRQEPPVSSEGAPAVVCVVPPARRSPAEPPVFSSPSLAAQPSPARLAAPHQGQQPPALPHAPGAHVVHSIMSYPQAPLAAGHAAHPAHATYGENLSVKSDAGGGGAAQYSAGSGAGPATAAAAAAGPVPHSSAPQVSPSGLADPGDPRCRSAGQGTRPRQMVGPSHTLVMRLLLTGRGVHSQKPVLDRLLERSVIHGCVAAQ